MKFAKILEHLFYRTHPVAAAIQGGAIMSLHQEPLTIGRNRPSIFEMFSREGQSFRKFDVSNLEFH